MDRKRSTTLYLAKRMTGSESAVFDDISPENLAERSAPRTWWKRVGVWDIDVHAGFLHYVLDAINEAQEFLLFRQIDAVVPTALTLSGDRNKQIMRDAGVRFNDIEDNTWAPDLYKIARPVLKQLPIDLLAVTVTPMIMEYEDDGETLGWNFFSTSKGKIILVSSFGLRTYATAANRTPEACLAFLVLSATLSQINSKPEHDDTRGCLFDFCNNRDEIVASFRSMNICDECGTKWSPKRLAEIRKMLAAVRDYRRPQ
jgi:hypothetical protein